MEDISENILLVWDVKSISLIFFMRYLANTTSKVDFFCLCSGG